MPVPKKRHTRARQGPARRRFERLAEKGLSKCPSCGSYIRSHHACLSCGSYKGRAVIKIKPLKKKSSK